MNKIQEFVSLSRSICHIIARVREDHENIRVTAKRTMHLNRGIEFSPFYAYLPLPTSSRYCGQIGARIGAVFNKEYLPQIIDDLVCYYVGAIDFPKREVINHATQFYLTRYLKVCSVCLAKRTYISKMDKLWRCLYSDRPPLHKSSTLQKQNTQRAFNKNVSSFSVKLDQVERKVRH